MGENFLEKNFFWGVLGAFCGPRGPKKNFFFFENFFTWQKFWGSTCQFAGLRGCGFAGLQVWLNVLCGDFFKNFFDSWFLGGHLRTSLAGREVFFDFRWMGGQ